MSGLSKLKASWRKRRFGRSLVISLPYGWLALFFLVPFAIVFKISLSEAQIAIPPYSDLVTFVDDKLQMVLNISNYYYLLEDDLYVDSYLQSVKIAAHSTLFCLLMGLPIAWAIVHSSPASRNLWLMLIILPSWTSFLIRIYAWIGILKNNGLMNNLLLWLGVIDQPLQILHTPWAVYIGIVYAYLPFMILPLYSALMRLDYSLVEAAQDLGARQVTVFFQVILPAIKGGVIAGAMLVFIPAVGEFVIPELLGGPDSLLIGRVLWQEFFNNRDWPVASAVAMVMLLLLMVPILWFHRYQTKELEGRA
ncbi:binding-protein-dependent transport systems inner membrane component [Ferrimonas balearica DSM 9799]|uniref:Binding-protein-dependent transport systems inner membrane component n=1 Tax=Ferrimonas balearica (strain DSM 9799 / CCM 4581 / KCTC 23876 / PAT) TaxID=550540 RepID=E1SVK4_FERBD|nr:putrescine ABC transporter permease PotH [Ferrimonas balearica]ADN75350.1 binding-protein-dependent transport systems inner membrane component [Ferrimonas balearica DSM 9799]MBW3138262.1 putrescine ABC transporter permease PotH [Ferrimonas balearica]MBW3164186.1 putrescine ABC transporter permease PotH [Ferrimonas balearica]MBY5979008.1 putrescine ABC transporter permease PotH [Ferrimonas balearica]MBY6105323.1 putrescine ABC transporter permease PotH [Ferrimonas balearica]